MWDFKPARAVLHVRQDGKVLRVAVTRDATAEERVPAVVMLVVVCFLAVGARAAPWQLLFFFLLIIGVLSLQVFFGTAVYRSSLEASLDGLTFRRDAGLLRRRSRFIPAWELRNLLFDSAGKATESGLYAKRILLPDVCVLPYVDEAQSVELRKLIFELMALTPEHVMISHPVDIR